MNKYEKDKIREKVRKRYPLKLWHKCIRCGITQEDCLKVGSTLERHHEDIENKPFEIEFACVDCHKNFLDKPLFIIKRVVRKLFYRDVKPKIKTATLKYQRRLEGSERKIRRLKKQQSEKIKRDLILKNIHNKK